MPECVTVNHPVEMSPAERKLYDEFEAQMVLSLDGKSVDAANAAVLSGRLLEMATGAVYNDSHEVVQIHERKLEMACGSCGRGSWPECTDCLLV